MSNLDFEWHLNANVNYFFCLKKKMMILRSERDGKKCSKQIFNAMPFTLWNVEIRKKAKLNIHAETTSST